MALGGIAGSIVGQETSEGERLSVVLRARLAAGRPVLSAEGKSWRGSADLSCFYERRSFVPAWITEQGPSPEVEDLLSAIGGAEEDGLRPEDYRLSSLRKLATAERAPSDALARADFDLLFSDAFLTFASHLRHGTVNPEQLYSDCALTPDAADLPAVLEAALREHRVRAAIAELAPPADGYRRLRAALRRYRELAGRPAPDLVAPGPTLRLGDRGERLVSLRSRLADAATADAAAPVLSAAEPDRFDESLAEAVRAFQSRHGLAEDGAVGPVTLAELNLRAEDHVRTIEANLERWRWLPHDLGRRYVLVNIAAFHLVAVADGRTELEMRAIVGKPFTKTPMFSSAMNAVVWNPSWYVPKKIAVEEILPKAAKDSGYLRREGYEVLGPNRLRQKPGPGNALGRIKFLFPNRFGVYLHDTPAPSLFGRTVRAFSHGCIRIEKPFDLAVWMLAGDQKWTSEAIRAAIDAGIERRIAIPEPIPVHVAYWTAWVDEDGTLRLGRDVYSRDAELFRELAAEF